MKHPTFLSGPSSLVVPAIRVLLFVFGAALCLHYGRRGFMALDQSIVFDGAWRVLSGQVPERDFFTPAGLAPIAIQAVFFKAMGVTWLAYCAHAATINGLFAVLVFNLLIAFEAPVALAAFYGAVSAVFLYPPFGVPYPDQHALFFSLAVIYAAQIVSDRRRTAASRRLGAALLPLLAVAAVLSKPIPSVPVVAVTALWLLWIAARGERRLVATTAAATALVTIGGAVAAVALHLRASDIWYFVYEVPSREMGWRLGNITNWAGLLARHHRVYGQMHQTSPLLLPLAAAALVPLLLPRDWRGEARALRATGILLLGLVLFGATLLFVYLTNNSPLNGLGLEPAALGLANTALLVPLAAIRSRPIRVGALTLASLPFLLVMSTDALAMNHDVNDVRLVHDERWVEAAPAIGVPPPLAYMRLNADWSSHDIADILAALQRHTGNFLLIGDSTVLYGATRHPSVFPILWMHPDLTMPSPTLPEFSRVEDRLLVNLRRYDVRYVVLEGTHTWGGITLDTFPRVAAAARECRREVAGRWTFVDLCHALP